MAINNYILEDSETFTNRYAKEMLRTPKLMSEFKTWSSRIISVTDCCSGSDYENNIVIARLMTYWIAIQVNSGRTFPVYGGAATMMAIRKQLGYLKSYMTKYSLGSIEDAVLRFIVVEKQPNLVLAFC